MWRQHSATHSTNEILWHWRPLNSIYRAAVLYFVTNPTFAHHHLYKGHFMRDECLCFGLSGRVVSTLEEVIQSECEQFRLQQRQGQKTHLANTYVLIWVVTTDDSSHILFCQNQPQEMIEFGLFCFWFTYTDFWTTCLKEINRMWKLGVFGVLTYSLLSNNIAN